MASFSFPSSSIDQIIAGGAGASSRADFSRLPSILDTFYKGRDEAYQQAGRDLFQNGIPTNPDGSPDFETMSKALFQHGDIGQGTALSNLNIARQQLKLGQQAAGAISALEGGGQPPAAQPATAGPQAPIVSPPSGNRNAGTVVAPPLNKGGVVPQQPQPKATLLGVLAAQGIPNDQLGPAAASVGRQLGITDPTQPIDLQDPQVRNVLIPAIQQLKRMGIGQVVPQGQPSPAPQVIPQQVAHAQPQPTAPQAPQPNPQQNQGTFGAPSAIATRGAIPTGTDPEIQKQIAIYTALASNPAYPQSVRDAAKTRLEALQQQAQPTPEMKNYDLARRQGSNLKFEDYQADQAQKAAGASEDAKLSAQKYQTLVDNGTKAQMEIPQLNLLQQQMNDPNFFSGAGEKYDLLYKRLKAAVGIDPNVAVPQEFLRKATAANVLASLGALKGLGQIRKAEITMAQQAAAAPENSIPANKLLIEISKRTYQRQADIADMAQAYKEQNGSLDAGFDKQVTDYYKQHPLFSDAEINDWHRIIGEQKNTTTATTAAPPIQGARRAPDGNWYVSDPKRPGKYLKVVQ